ncbi:probable NADH dehydrogenase [ubiquinone] 1 alpha subcomplex subunit 12 [Homalodisca vitripennis]|uniref:probable NADH dehydrogenase [ubiquinone] 1 alpha subcomplex subunit 12 n=1 Tax=Homalodisca vitripennis TaxID=197043 RepID=UPI001EE9CD52|nr:probable NADH dehydrogenase [ubiquinone] 1 alpha subcomplex subunit 12 [Homalodisca vitripennis]KAG8332649.1 NADH dehydrogenase 1 alpha subcomplex subunit 12 ndufa12/DAP13 [Homalodisca vitripennis]
MVLGSIVHTWRVVRHNGGLWRSLMALFVRDDLKLGTFVGEDDYGNKYYENNNYFLGRNRWVNYADSVFLDYDASQVPAEWYGWLHYRTDLLPHQDPSRPKYPWMARHTENMTATREQYVPYSTTRPKIQAWCPPKSRDCCFKLPPAPKTAQDECPPPRQKRNMCDNL